MDVSTIDEIASGATSIRSLLFKLVDAASSTCFTTVSLVKIGYDSITLTSYTRNDIYLRNFDLQTNNKVKFGL